VRVHAIYTSPTQRNANAHILIYENKQGMNYHPQKQVYEYYVVHTHHVYMHSCMYKRHGYMHTSTRAPYTSACTRSMYSYTHARTRTPCVHAHACTRAPCVHTYTHATPCTYLTPIITHVTRRGGIIKSKIIFPHIILCYFIYVLLKELV